MTELKLQFQVEVPELPIDMDKVMVSFLKAAVENYSVELFDRLYNKKESITKKFCWSCYFPQAKFTSEVIRLGANKFTMNFSDCDIGELLMFYNAFSLMKYKTFHMNRNSMKLMSVKTKQLKEIKETEVIIKMQSSLLARKHNSDDNTDIYYTCEDTEFPEIVKENLRIFLQKINLECDINDFSVTPLKGKKIVARVWQRPTDASVGIYKLTGNPQLLEILRTAGLGVRRGLGHGKFVIIY